MHPGGAVEGAGSHREAEPCFMRCACSRLTLLLIATSAGAAEIKPFAREDMASDASASRRHCAPRP